MPSIHPWSTTHDLRLTVNALRSWLLECERDPIDTYKLAVAWDGVRSSFGEPGTAPKGVSVDGNGIPDRDGVSELIRISSLIGQQGKEELFDLIDEYPRMLNALALSMATSGRRYVAEPIRKFRKQLRHVISLLEMITRKEIKPLDGALPEWAGEHFSAKQYKLIKALWGGSEMTIKDLLKQVYPKETGKEEALDKLKQRANKKLAENSIEFEIKERRNEVYVLVPLR